MSRTQIVFLTRKTDAMNLASGLIQKTLIDGISATTKRRVQMWNETLINPGDYVVNFSLNQKLPPGYTVQWWECDEHYHWVKSADVYGVAHWDRFACRRGAWAHYRAQKKEPKTK